MACQVPSQNLSDASLKPNVCDDKCKLNYNYNATSLLVTQDTSVGYYNFRSENENVPSVEYNSTKYAATGFNLYNGPVHNYGSNSGVNAEVIIMHKIKDSLSASNEENLCICIPIIIKDSGAGSPLDILVESLSNAMDGKNSLPDYIFGSKCSNNVKDETDQSCGVHISTANFKLGDLIPEENYIVYVGSDIMNQSCSSRTNTRYVVFNKATNPMVLSKTQATNSKLVNLPTEHYDQSEKGPDGGFYVFPFVPGENADGDDIYIDCKPVETTDTKKKETLITIGPPAFLSGISFTKILNFLSDYIPTIIGVILMIMLWKIGNYLYGPKCPGSNCEPPLEKLRCPVNIKK